MVAPPAVLTPALYPLQPCRAAFARCTITYLGPETTAAGQVLKRKAGREERPVRGNFTNNSIPAELHGGKITSEKGTK